MATTDIEGTGDTDTEGTDNGDSILETLPIGFPWPTVDPFIAAVHHRDHFPAGNAEMGPATTEGRRPEGAGFSTPGWGMYHGSVVPGFPQHPHRGFETVTFVRRGTIDHSDSLGATARYGGGDVQWLTAGRGMQHAEMFPLLRQDAPNTTELFQIWLNLPSHRKLVEPSFTMLWREELPRTVVKDGEGRATEVTVVAGPFGDVQPLPAPPDSWAATPEAELAIWQCAAEPGARWTLPPTVGRNTVRTLYVFEGALAIGGTVLEAPTAAVLRSDAGRWRSPRGIRERRTGPAGPAHRRAGGHGRAVRDERPQRDRAGVPRLPAHRVRWLALGRHRSGAPAERTALRRASRRTHRVSRRALTRRRRRPRRTVSARRAPRLR